jgi:hypothetical protein
MSHIPFSAADRRRLRGGTDLGTRRLTEPCWLVFFRLPFDRRRGSDVCMGNSVTERGWIRSRGRPALIAAHPGPLDRFDCLLAEKDDTLAAAL